MKFVKTNDLVFKEWWEFVPGDFVVTFSLTPARCQQQRVAIRPLPFLVLQIIRMSRIIVCYHQGGIRKKSFALSRRRRSGASKFFGVLKNVDNEANPVH